jgi:hypothetical protein
VEREDIFKPTIGIESLHENSNDNGARVVNLSLEHINKRLTAPTECDAGLLY